MEAPVVYWKQTSTTGHITMIQFPLCICNCWEYKIRNTGFGKCGIVATQLVVVTQAGRRLKSTEGR